MAQPTSNEPIQVTLCYNHHNYQPFVNAIKELFYASLQDLISTIAFNKSQNNCAKLIIEFWAPPFSRSQRHEAMSAAFSAHKAFAKCLTNLPMVENQSDQKERELGPVSTLAELLATQNSFYMKQTSTRSLHNADLYKSEEKKTIVAIIEELESEDLEERISTFWHHLEENKNSKIQEDLIILQKIDQIFSNNGFSYAFQNESEHLRANKIAARLHNPCTALEATATAEMDLF